VRSPTSPRCSPTGGGNEAAAALERALEGYERKKTLSLGDALPRLAGLVSSLTATVRVERRFRSDSAASVLQASSFRCDSPCSA
jgi:hypothetical protein